MDLSSRNFIVIVTFATCLFIWLMSTTTSAWIPTSLIISYLIILIARKTPLPNSEELAHVRHSMRWIIRYLLFPAQLLFLGLLWLTLRATYSDIDPTGDFQKALLGEGGLWENAQVLFLLLGIIFFLKHFAHYRSRSAAVRWLAVVGFSLLLLFTLGEETNWGQRWLHFPTPALLASSNMDAETNLHEIALPGLSLETIANFTVKLLLLSYGILLPLCAWAFPRVQALADRLNCPLPHGSGAILVLLALGIETPWFINGVLQLPEAPFMWDASELRETVLYFILMVSAMYSTRRWRLARRHTRPIHP